MRTYFSFVFLFVCFLCSNSYSQDLIVTNVGDSIDCKVLAQTKEYIRFVYTRYNNNSTKELRSGLVKSVVIDFYQKPDSAKEKVNDPVRKTTAGDTSITIIAGDITEPKTSGWQLSINGGYAYRLFKPRIKSTSFERKYIDELKSGYSAGAEAFYFPWKKWGLGLKYDIYKSKSQRDIRTMDDVTIQFAGASVAHKMMFHDKKASVIAAFWLSYQPYRNAVRFIGQDYNLKARTMGWGISVGVDRKITQNLAVSAGISGFMGSVYKWKKEWKGRSETISLPKDHFEDLTRAEFTIGLKLLP